MAGFIFGILTAHLSPINAQVSCEKVEMLLKTVNKFHYQPRPIDDAFSELVYTQFLDNIDPDNNILDQEDHNQLEPFRFGIDDEINNHECIFIQRFKEILEEKISYVTDMIDQLTKDDLDFITPDSLIFDEQKTVFSKSDLRREWIKLIQYEILESYFYSTDSVSITQEDFQIKLDSLLNEVIASESCELQNREDQYEQLDGILESYYLSVIAASFDPHTTYFNEGEETDYLEALAVQKLSFGLEIIQNESFEIEILSLEPGSPAWKSNKLNVGDVILAVTTADGTVHNFNCITAEEAYHILNGRDIDELDFRVRTLNDEEIEFSLDKEMIDIETNTIRAYILDGEKKIAYISLPAFYTDELSLSESTKGCAEDLAKELIKLKKEVVDGLILDIRNNGGGSMNEAIRLAGIFIDHGTVCIYDTSIDEPQNWKDKDRGRIFRQELIIMVDESSASASELLAASLQDYNRAVIVGTDTYGKSSTQVVLPLDAANYSLDNIFENNTGEYIKLTVGAFFRADGSSHQHTGVKPDIKLPVYDFGISQIESDFPSSLVFKPLETTAKIKPYKALPLKLLKEKSQARLSENTDFQDIIEYNKTSDQSSGSYAIPINFESYYAYYMEDYGFYDNIDTSATMDSLYTVLDPAYMKLSALKTKPDDDYIDYNKAFIFEDIYIRESYNVILDLIKSKIK